MSSQGVRVHLCGQLRIEIAGERREDQLHGRQGRLLFAFLMLSRHRPVRRDELVELLWSDEGAPPSPGALSPVLSRLRRVLTPGTIDGRDALRLTLPDPVWLDVEAAREAVSAARRASVEDRLRLAHEALGLLEGGLLPGLEAGWLEDFRQEAEELRLQALELGAEAAASVDPALAEGLARTAVNASPFRESAWGALIRALRARGNLAEALRAYEDLRTRLRDELGTAPGRELLALHTELLGESEAPPSEASAEATPPLPTDLLQREAEIAAVDAALRRTRGGEGRVLVFEGPAGIGKTRLLGELRRRASAAGWLVVEARASLLEREYGFGVVRQLFEAVAEPTMLEGSTSAARAVLADGGTGEREGTFPILNALFHLVERLADQRPLVLCLDDLQWSDPASLRFVVYVGRRLANLPVLMAATVRPGEPDVDEVLLEELAHEPLTETLRPRPLTPEGTAGMIRNGLGQGAESAFTAACHEVTAGNPLLVRQLISSLNAEAVTPDAAHAEAVRAIGPRAVARTVQLRLRRMPEPASTVARAVAVLGEQPPLAAVAGLAGTEERAAAQAIGALVRAEILRGEDPLGFVHPLIREAVYAELPPPARELEHERAARLLADCGASPERVAAQLLLVPHRGDPWVVERLRDAADEALRRGAPDAAMRLLERAQDEPPSPQQQPALALALGGSAAYIRGPAGVEPLRRAYAGLEDPVERGRAAIRLSHLLLFVSSPREGIEVAERAAAELPPELEDLHQGLRALRLVGAAFGAVDPAEFRVLDDVRGGARGRGPGALALTAMTALATALTCGPAAEASALAREAFAPGLEAFEVTAPIALGAAALALGEPEDGLQAIANYAEYARRQGEILSSIGADLWGGITQIWAGDLRAAMDLLERAHEGERLWGTKLDAVMAYSAAFTALAQLERGDDPEQVEQTLHRVDARDPRPDGARFWLASLAELRLAQGRPEQAVEVTRRLEPTRPPDTHPVWAPWRSLRARALIQLGELDAAERLAAAELELARRTGAPWVIGRALRLLAECGGAERLEHAEQAVQALAQTSARLELAKSHQILGEALAERGSSEAARDQWAHAQRIAQECGAAGLARRAMGAAGRASALAS